MSARAEAHGSGFDTSVKFSAGVIEQIEEHFKSLTRGRPEGRLVIDFANVQALSSKMLGVLVTAHNELSEQDGTIALSNLHRTHQKLPPAARLSDLSKISPDRASATEGRCAALPAD